MEEFLTDPYAIAAFIKNSVKKTPVKLYINGDFSNVDFGDLKVYGCEQSKIIFGDVAQIDAFLQKHPQLSDFVLENDRRNSAIPLLDISHIDARIEPGAIIRQHASIGKNAVIMMGAVINIGAIIGDSTMIDMNAVIGARGSIGKNCHIGAGAVIAGVLEPPSRQPVILGDNVLVGANAVILEGVRVGNNAVIAAGSVVLDDVEDDMVVAGSPARVIKRRDEKTDAKTEILADLRK